MDRRNLNKFHSYCHDLTIWERAGKETFELWTTGTGTGRYLLLSKGPLALLAWALFGDKSFIDGIVNGRSLDSHCGLSFRSYLSYCLGAMTVPSKVGLDPS